MAASFHFVSLPFFSCSIVNDKRTVVPHEHKKLRNGQFYFCCCTIIFPWSQHWRSKACSSYLKICTCSNWTGSIRKETRGRISTSILFYPLRFIPLRILKTANLDIIYINYCGKYSHIRASWVWNVTYDDPWLKTKTTRSGGNYKLQS